MRSNFLLQTLLPVALIAAPLAAAQAPASQVVVQRDLVYGQADGVDLKLDFVRPGEGSGPFPLVVCLHGGGWQTGNKAAYGMVLQLFAQHGYAAASVDYRLAPRYPFPAQIDDVRRAARYLREHAVDLKVDPNRVATLGDSAGGHLALLLGLSDPDDGIRVIVNLYGPSDLPRWKATPVGEAGLGMSSTKLLENVFGTSDPASAALRDASPINKIGRAKPAVLTFHGDSDPLVNMEQSLWLHEALRKAGLEEKLVVVKGGAHGFQGADLANTIRTTLEFLDAHFKAPAGAALQTR
jgi:acetyl esterase/lipase